MAEISRKSADEIELMAKGGAMLGQTLQAVAAAVGPGVTPRQLSVIAGQTIEKLGGQAAFLGHHGFPDPICISVNEAIVHGIPGSTPLVDGDIVGLDFGVRYKGLITDGAITVAVGTPRKEAQQLLDVTQEALAAGIAQARPGNRVGDISAAIERVLRRHKLGIIEDLVGHGVGYDLWEEPNIPNHGKAHRGPLLAPGMTIAIEPMATLGTHEITMDADGWTIRTADNSLAAQFEHTVAITEGEPRILTQP